MGGGNPEFTDNLRRKCLGNPEGVFGMD